MPEQELQNWKERLALIMGGPQLSPQQRGNSKASKEKQMASSQGKVKEKLQEQSLGSKILKSWYKGYFTYLC